MNYTIRASVFNKSKESDSSVKGFATVVFGNSFKITNIAIVENKTTGDIFVSMPRYQSNEKDGNGNQIYKDVCNPVTKEFREELYTNILNTFKKAQEEDKAMMTVDASDKDSPKFTVSVTPFEREGSSIKGLARIYINDSFIVSNINLIQGANGLFVTMPSYKTKQIDENGKSIYQDICYPVTKDFRERLYGAILEEYKTQKNRTEDNFLDYIEQQDINQVKEAQTSEKTGPKQKTEASDVSNDTMDNASKSQEEKKETKSKVSKKAKR